MGLLVVIGRMVTPPPNPETCGMADTSRTTANAIDAQDVISLLDNEGRPTQYRILVLEARLADTLASQTPLNQIYSLTNYDCNCEVGSRDYHNDPAVRVWFGWCRRPLLKRKQ
eukprot:scaffold315263_cov24-Attheya_sp.AAC.2